MTDRMFVYGTLMEGRSQAGLLGDVRRWSASTRGSLWDLPAGYPALGAGGDWVYGELVELPALAILTILDRYEGVDEGLFRRVEVEVSVALRLERAWTYLMDDPRSRGGRRLPHGRWQPRRRR